MKSNIMRLVLVVLALILVIAGLALFWRPAHAPETMTPERAIALIPGLSSHARYFGNEATGDLDHDGKPDTAFLLVDEPGGSGTFFYVAALLSSAKDFPTNAVLLGDRVAPQTTEIRDGELVVNYADRKPSDPMSVAPSIGATKYLKAVDGALVPSR